MPYGGDPSASTLDAVRFYAQDTGATPLLSDAEINFFIGQDLFASNPVLIAAYVADTIAARYAGEVSISADGVSYSGDQLQQKYTALAKTLRENYTEMLSLCAPTPYVGGITLGEPRPYGTRPPSFGIGATDNARAGRQFYPHRGEAIADAAAIDEEDWA